MELAAADAVNAINSQIVPTDHFSPIRSHKVSTAIVEIWSILENIA